MLQPARLLNVSCTVTPRTETGVDNELVDGDPFDTVCWLHQFQRDETTAGTDSTSETWTVYLRADIEVDALCSIDVQGMTLELLGPPQTWTHPTAGEAILIEATARKVA